LVSWSKAALAQIAFELGQVEAEIDFDASEVSEGEALSAYTPPQGSGELLGLVERILDKELEEGGEGIVTLQHAITAALVAVHLKVQTLSENRQDNSGGLRFISPRDYLDFIGKFSNIFREKKESLQDQERHVALGLLRLEQTSSSVVELQVGFFTHISYSDLWCLRMTSLRS